MNRFKDVSRHLLTFLDTVKKTGADQRCVAMVKSKMQKACMFACRSVAHPEYDC